MSKLKVGDVVQILDDLNSHRFFERRYSIGLVTKVNDPSMAYSINIRLGHDYGNIDDSLMEPKHLKKIGTLD